MNWEYGGRQIDSVAGHNVGERRPTQLACAADVKDN